jgi:transposase
MGNPRGVRRNAEQLKELERRRLLGAHLLRRGVPQAEVARQVGVHRQSVSRWAEQLRHGGRRELKSAGRIGRKPRLGPAELKRIVRRLQRGPEALGYENGLWTAWRVADLIERECGVKFSAVQAWRILRQLGWTPQRPVGRALERDEEKIRRWKQRRWPGIKKKPKKKGHHRLPRRKRTERAAAPETHLGPPGANARAAISLHLEDAFRRGRYHILEFLFSAVCRGHPQPAGHRVSGTSASAARRQAAHRLGRTSRASQPGGMELRAATARTHLAGISARLCAGAESDRIHLGASQATRTGQFLPQGLRGVERCSHPRPETDASPPNARHGLLAASATLSIITIL